MPPITDVRDISRIAYGFMASRALFAALEVDVFGRLAAGPKSLEELAGETRQIYPTLQHLDAALRGERVDFYAQMRDPAEARAFSLAQHSGSLGPAHVVARPVDLAGARRLLDGGGAPRGPRRLPAHADGARHHAAAVRGAVMRW